MATLFVMLTPVRCSGGWESWLRRRVCSPSAAFWGIPVVVGGGMAGSGHSPAGSNCSRVAIWHYVAPQLSCALPPTSWGRVVASIDALNDGENNPPSWVLRAETLYFILHQASCPQLSRVADLRRLLALRFSGTEPWLASPSTCRRDPSQMSRSQHQAWPPFRLPRPDCIRQIC